jgi:hypothetical protein
MRNKYIKRGPYGPKFKKKKTFAQVIHVANSKPPSDKRPYKLGPEPQLNSEDFLKA